MSFAQIYELSLRLLQMCSGPRVFGNHDGVFSLVSNPFIGLVLCPDKFAKGR